MSAKCKKRYSSNKGTCANMVTIRRLDLEARILEAHKQRLMEPQLFALFCEELTREINRLHMEGRAQLSGSQNKLKRITRELDKLFDLYLAGKLDKEGYITRFDSLQAGKGELQRLLDTASAPLALLHPHMAPTDRQALEGLYENLHSDAEHTRHETTSLLRSLTEQSVLIPIKESKG